MDKRVLDSFLFEMLFEVRTRFAEFDASALDAADPEVLIDEMIQCDAPGRHISAMASGVQFDAVIPFHSCKGLTFDKSEITSLSGSERSLVPKIAITTEPPVCNPINRIYGFHGGSLFGSDMNPFDRACGSHTESHLTLYAKSVGSRTPLPRNHTA